MGKCRRRARDAGIDLAGVRTRVGEKPRGARDTAWIAGHENGWYSVSMEKLLTTLYRPAGQAELELIRTNGFREFPPRLPDRPIFYPVLTEEYAVQIARDWNTKDEQSGFAGYVLRFQMRTTFLRKYDVHVVGSSEHCEYWIPANELAAFNANIVGSIEVVAEFREK